MVDRDDVRDAAKRGRKGLQDTAEAVRGRSGTLRWVAIGFAVLVVAAIVVGSFLGW